jgi:hypothetical protein
MDIQVTVIDRIDLVTPYYLLMHRDMQQTPRVRAFADFVASEIRCFRASVGVIISSARRPFRRAGCMRSDAALLAGPARHRASYR